jgi:hypothetical protein
MPLTIGRGPRAQRLVVEPFSDAEKVPRRGPFSRRSALLACCRFVGQHLAVSAELEFWAARREVVDVVELDHDEGSGSRMDRRHARSGFVETRHAVDPGVHVPAVEVGEAERLGEDVVERRPIANGLRADHDRGHRYSAQPSALLPVSPLTSFMRFSSGVRDSRRCHSSWRRLGIAPWSLAPRRGQVNAAWRVVENDGVTARVVVRHGHWILE